MDLLACLQCTHRFYVPGAGDLDGRWCPQCGGGLGLSLRGTTSIPLDARWLDPRAAAADPPTVTHVELRRKGERAGKTGKRIVRELANYFGVRANGRSIEVSVNRGEPADAALRVAAVLDGVNTGWEEHFYLPTADPQDPPGELKPSAPRMRGNLRLVASNGDRVQPQGSA
jgi:hypothetical protein